MSEPPQEIRWGTAPFEIEDTLDVQDGDLGELDVASIDILVEFGAAMPSIREQLNSLGFPKGVVATYAPLSSIGQFFTQGWTTRRQGGFGIASVSLIGMTDEFEERRLRELSAFGQMVSVGPIDGVQIAVPGVGLAERWNINDPSVTIVDTYFVQGDEPDMSAVGLPFSPTSPPSTPTFKWGLYQEPVRLNAPPGWVLDDRKVTKIIGDLYKVVDTVNYYQIWIPD